MTVYTPTSERQAPATTHRQMWALGDYAAIAEELLAPLGPILVSTSGIRRGDRVLDVAAGSGNVSIPAAMAGAHVTASDLTPELLRRAQARAAAAGLELGWREANAEALPFSAGEFDAVLSTIGVMFAPRHQRTADELARVCRRGGKISTLNWTPEGFYGKLLSTIRPYRPTLPAGAPHEVWWGSEDYGLREWPVSRPCVRHPYPARIADSGPVRLPGRMSRLFQEFLRPGDQRLPLHRRQPRVRRHTRRRNHRTLSRIPLRRRDAVGIPYLHRPEVLS